MNQPGDIILESGVNMSAYQRECAARATGIYKPGAVHILSLGAGVQSSTMALMAALGEIKPMPACAIFADTQAEPGSVYRWLDWLEKQLPFPVHRVTKGNIIETITTTRQRKDGTGWYVCSNIPAFVVNPDGSRGIIPRQCTVNFKIEPIRKKAREVGNIRRGQKEIGVVQWIGISCDESHRMKPSREAWQENRWPLVDLRMTRADCLRWMEERGFPTPPRSSCIFCPFHSAAEWRRLQLDEPAEFARAVDIEKRFQAAKRKGGIHGEIFLHRSCVPLDQVDFRSPLEREQGVPWGNECEGVCGV